MSTEILPEVKAKQEAERVRKEEERRQKAALLAVRGAQGREPCCHSGHTLPYYIY